MDIPMWLPWVAFLALLPVAVLKSESRVARMAPAAVALLVAAWVSVDRLHVSEDELFEETERATSLVDGALGGTSADTLSALIEDRLHREVRLTNTSSRDGYDVQLADSDGGPRVCIEVESHDVNPNLPGLVRETLSVSTGPCDG